MCETSALIAEDDESLVMIFAKALEQAGFTVDVARTGDEALIKLTESRPRVVVLDLHLPNISGVSLIKFIRRDARMRDARVIVVSADAALAGDCQSMADLVLVKPISFIQLRDLAARLK